MSDPTSAFLGALHRKGLRSTIRRSVEIAREKGPLETLVGSANIANGLARYYLRIGPKRASDLPPSDPAMLEDRLRTLGIQVIPYHVDAQAFAKWLKKMPFPLDYRTQHREVFPEKALEHYLSSSLLGLSEGDVFLDVGASTSPWASMASQTFGVKGHILDLSRRGLHGAFAIQADATKMPFADESVDSIALHCALETFEGDADIGLAREASRVLKVGGRMVIAPLYLGSSHYAETSPWVDRRTIDYGEAEPVWRESRGRVRFSRKYDADGFVRRIANGASDVETRVLRIANTHELGDNIYCNWVAMMEKKS